MVGVNAAKLALPSHYRIHPVLNVCLLKIYKEDNFPRTLNPAPAIVDGIPYYTVEIILSHRRKKHRRKAILEFLVKWVGYDDTHNSWEPLANLEGAECRNGYSY